MNRMVLFPCIVIIGLLEAVAGQTAPAVHRLGPTPRTITWGYFDARTPPVLKVHSGDTVEIESLIAVTVEALEAAGLQRNQIQPALLEIDHEVKDRGEIPHILTGPIWVEEAEPGDVLEVKINSIEAVVPYALNFFGPGRGFLPDQFPYSRYKITPLDLKRQWQSSQTTLKSQCGPFSV